MKYLVKILTLLLWSTNMSVQALELKSFNLVQERNGTQMEYIDANIEASGESQKTEAQKVVDWIKSVNGNHVLLIATAHMEHYNSSEVIPSTPVAERSKERQRWLRFMQYAKSQGIKVGIRPIILLKNTQGNRFWHGNIQPADPGKWFESLRLYLENYARIAKMGSANDFTIAAELYSMTVGLEDQWPQNPFGFPREWTQLIRNLRTKLSASTTIMYDINYTDARVNSDGTGPSGGEIERWRYRLVDLKPDPSRPATMSPSNQAAWLQLKDLWSELDMIGIDEYRSLLAAAESTPTDTHLLIAKLTQTAETYASDLDNKLWEISEATGEKKKVIIKEIGFKSCEKCFINPFVYDDPRLKLNLLHQSAAYQAIINAFIAPKWEWMQGISWWDVSTNSRRKGLSDAGFTPRGKPNTEDVIRAGWR